MCKTPARSATNVSVENGKCHQADSEAERRRRDCALSDKQWSFDSFWFTERKKQDLDVWRVSKLNNYFAVTFTINVERVLVQSKTKFNRLDMWQSFIKIHPFPYFSLNNINLLCKKYIVRSSNLKRTINRQLSKKRIKLSWI